MNRNYSSLKAYKLGLSPDSSTWYMGIMMTLSSHQHPQVEVFLPDRGVPNSNPILGSSLDNCTHPPYFFLRQWSLPSRKSGKLPGG
jgi:hypothetical protein